MKGSAVEHPDPSAAQQWVVHEVGRAGGIWQSGQVEGHSPPLQQSLPDGSLHKDASRRMPDPGIGGGREPLPAGETVLYRIYTQCYKKSGRAMDATPSQGLFATRMVGL